jgi:hypothetical protein
MKPNQRDTRSRRNIGAKKKWRTPCDLYPDKTRFADHHSAVVALHHIQNSTNTGVKPHRAYECACGGWHLSSKEQ